MNMPEIDLQLFRILNSLAAVRWVEAALKLFVNEYFVPVLLALILFYLWLQPDKKYKKVAVLAAVAVGLVNLVIKVLNIYFDNPRPFELMEVNLAYYQPTDPSFPSNGAAVSFAIATAVWLYHKKLGRFALGAAILFSLGRVAAGIHFPSDVLVGAILGVLFSSVLYKLNFVIETLTGLLSRVLKTLRLEQLP